MFKPSDSASVLLRHFCYGFFACFSFLQFSWLDFRQWCASFSLPFEELCCERVQSVTILSSHAREQILCDIQHKTVIFSLVPSSHFGLVGQTEAWMFFTCMASKTLPCGKRLAAMATLKHSLSGLLLSFVQRLSFGKA